jgi:predicted RNA-binding protein Jag
MKKLIESMDHIDECGMTEMPAAALPAPEMDKGNPVTVNVSMNASGKEHVADLLDMMKNAGLGAAEEVGPKMLSPRMDMERLSAMMDEPEMENTQPGMEPDPDSDDEVTEGATKAVIDMVANADDPSQMVMDLIAKGGPEGQYLYGELEQLASEQGKTFNNAESEPEEFVDELLANMGIEEGVETEDMSDEGTYTIKVKGKNMASQDELARLAGMSGSSDIDVDEAGDYANEPDPQYGDMSDAIPDGNDLNRKKKAYPATQDGDNPMAVENIKAALYAALTEKKKPDADGDGVPDWADKKPGKDDNAGKGSKPKKGKVPPQFQKEEMTAEGRGKVMAGRGRGKDKLMAGRGRGKKK